MDINNSYRLNRVILYFLWILTIMIILDGCAGSAVQTYQGPPKDKSEVATIITRPFDRLVLSGQKLAIISVDGKPLVGLTGNLMAKNQEWFGGRDTMEVLPGKHVFEVLVQIKIHTGWWTGGFRLAKGIRQIQADIQAGHTYLLSINVIKQIGDEIEYNLTWKDITGDATYK